MQISVLLQEMLKDISKLVPTRKQWRSWSLPSRLTAISALLAVVGTLATLLAWVGLDLDVKSLFGGGSAKGEIDNFVSIEVAGSQATAVLGGSALSEYNIASISVLVTRPNGEPVVDLAPPGHTGHARAPAQDQDVLPTGWTLKTRLVPSGGCVLVPRRIFNDESGTYELGVMTISAYGPCPWLAGEYRFQVELALPEANGIGVGSIRIK